MDKKLVQGVMVGAAAAAFALGLWVAGALDRWEYTTWTWRVQAFARPGPATDKIRLILLDQASLDWAQKEGGLSWPWPREIYSPIIDFCMRGGARSITFDVLYTEPSIYGAEDDERLGMAMGRSPSFVAALFLTRESSGKTCWPHAPLCGKSSFKIENLEEWLGRWSDSSVTIPRATFPIEEVASNAGVLANVMDEPDEDGIFRRARLFRIFDGRVVPSLGFAPFGASCPIDPSGKQDDRASRLVSLGSIGHGFLEAGGKRIPIDDEGRLILRFRGPAGTFRTVSAAAVIQSELLAKSGEVDLALSPEVFKDTHVFFGFSAPGLLDMRSTPLSRITPGAEVYATVLDNLLSGDFLRDTPRPLVFLSTLLLAFLCSIPVVALSRKVWHSVAAFAIFLPLPAALGFAAYPLGYWWPVILQESAVALSLVGAVVVNYATEGRQRALTKRAFQHYLSPAVIERILQDPANLKLGGERRELTIFFSDLEGFSSISERLDPEALTSLLNDYLSDMTDIILEEDGTLDKYEGDAIIAFWNAPLTQADHAERACRAALRCQHKLAERRDEFFKRTGAVLRMRIGLNTGDVVVGNMGSRNRFDYTVLGDAANLASRLEGANKAFGSFTMVSEETWDRLGGKFAGREMGLLRVVGRKTPVRVFELMDLSGEDRNPALREFERGLALCYAEKWQEALEIFESLLDDPVAKVYAERCRGVLNNQWVSWDSIWNLSQK